MTSFSILVNAVESKPKVRYLVAVDDSHSTLEDIVRVCHIKYLMWTKPPCIVQAVSTNLGTEKVTMIPAKDGLLIKDITVSVNQPYTLNYCNLFLIAIRLRSLNCQPQD